MPNSRASVDFCSPAAAQFDNLVVPQRFLAAPVGAALLGQSDPFALSLADQGPLELRKCSHDRQQQVRHRRVLASKAQAFLDEFDSYPALGQRLHYPAQIVKVARETVHAVHYYRVAFTGERQQGVELRSLCVLARGLVGEQLVYLDLIELTFWILIETADPDITNALTSQNVPP